MQLPFEVIFLLITKGMLLHIHDLSITIVIILLDTNEHHQIFAFSKVLYSLNTPIKRYRAKITSGKERFMFALCKISFKQLPW